jgi:hypothetical protein
MPYIEMTGIKENNDRIKPGEKSVPSSCFTLHGTTPGASYHDGHFSGWMGEYIFLIIANFAIATPQ